MKNTWSTKSLADVCQIRPPKAEARKLISSEDSVSFVPMEDLGIEQKIFIPVKERAFADVSGSYTYFADGDVLLAKITPCFENGKVGIAENLVNGIGFGSSEFIVFRPTEVLSNQWLYYFVSRESFREEGAKQMTGAVGHKRVSKEFIENYQIPIPPLPEQQRIVAILDEAFDGIATAKANAEKNLKNARELFESHLQSVFTQRGEGWVEKPLGNYCDLLNGFAFKSSDVVPESETQLVRMGNLYGNKFSLDRSAVFYPDVFTTEYQKYLLQEGDIVMSLTGTTGKEDYGYAVRIPECEHKLLMNQRIVKFDSIREEVIDRNYLLHFLRSRTFLDILYPTANGTRQANLSSVTIKTLLIPICSIAEQRKIANSFESLFDETERLELIYQQKITALDELKKSLLHKAFSGEL
ncbi:MAG: restriction endonuclease subunit S [Dehalococcoidales bacterium]|nr:restriction endonuclease subunit S [Dehalococcoidales bacterium]